MSNHLQIPASLVNAYTIACDGWKRATPWSRSTQIADHFQAIYTRESHGKESVKVNVRNIYIVDATAAMFEINMQLRRATSLKRRRESRKRA